jgi:DNA-binding CsgD family transcriptional regulator
MARGEAILATVRCIHEASLTADAWQPALQSIIELLGGDHAILLASDPARAEIALATSAGMDRGDFARFATPEAAQWIEPAMQAIRSGTVVTRSRLMPDRQFERTGFYNEVVRPAGGFHAVGVAHQAQALSSFVAICRPRQAGDFEADDVKLMQILSPHFATALHVRHRLGVADLAARGAWAALDRLNTGVIVADAAAAVVFANRTAERLFTARKLRLDGSGVGLGDGLDDEAASGELRRMVARCADPHAGVEAGGTVELAGDAWRAGLSIVVTPFQAERIGFDPGGCSKPLALLLVSDPQEERRRRMLALQRRFRLTPAEAEFALEIVKGDGRAAAAARTNITVGTARTHLDRIFEKTGVRRQAELVRLLLLDERA